MGVMRGWLHGCRVHSSLCDEEKIASTAAAHCYRLSRAAGYFISPSYKKPSSGLASNVNKEVGRKSNSENRGHETDDSDTSTELWGEDVRRSIPGQMAGSHPVAPAIRVLPERKNTTEAKSPGKPERLEGKEERKEGEGGREEGEG
ncbi:hypothetical protein EYF80_000764 [Liparis tanakae]|uniref:Uncharacterized protein n=1 Tax=Liparis tanakae TaxID=230148 RepID=A0A4Z2JF52_9TELE|nr:hypothetical protein EYF80_000764 [Liparis tanakae]